MLEAPMDVLTSFPVRKTKKQKQAFREAVQSYAQSLGYECAFEKGSAGSQNIVIGDPEKAKYLLTAHYDTCARLPFPNLITPCNFWPFFAYQMFIAVAIMALPLLPALPVGLLAGFHAGYLTWYFSFWVVFALFFFGPANPTNANDNTSGVIAVLETARTLPENQRGKAAFVLFDLEEAGLIGSASYRKAHKEQTDHQLILNLDCVGDGDHIRFFPTKKLKKDRKKLTSLYKACGYFGKKDVLVHEKGFSIYPSDQANFPYGAGICALHDSRVGLYMSRIHTPKDTVLEETNINLLRAGLTTLISQTEAEA